MPYVQPVEHKADIKSDGCRTDGHFDVLAVGLLQELIQSLISLRLGLNSRWYCSSLA